MRTKGIEISRSEFLKMFPEEEKQLKDPKPWLTIWKKYVHKTKVLKTGISGVVITREGED